MIKPNVPDTDTTPVPDVSIVSQVVPLDVDSKMLESVLNLIEPGRPILWATDPCGSVILPEPGNSALLAIEIITSDPDSVDTI